MAKPLYTSTTANCLGGCALQFAARYHLGKPHSWASPTTEPHVFKRYYRFTVAVKFTNRPSYYRVTWNLELGRYEIYVLPRKALSARD